MKTKENSVKWFFAVVALMVGISVCYTANLVERSFLWLRSQVGISAPLAVRPGYILGAERPNDDGSWSSDGYYMLYAVLPEWASEKNLDIRVEYPELTGTASTDEVVFTVTTSDGELYKGEYEIKSSENLRVIYGDTDPRVYSGGELYREGRTFGVFFSTMPADQYERYNQYLDNRFGWDMESYEYGYESSHGLSGPDGEMDVTFCRL